MNRPSVTHSVPNSQDLPPELLQSNVWFELSPMAQKAPKLGTDSSCSGMPHWPGDEHRTMESLGLELPSDITRSNLNSPPGAPLTCPSALQSRV